MRLAYAVVLLTLVGLVASLEASPIPLQAASSIPKLEGFSLIVVRTSSSVYSDVVEYAARHGVGLLVVVDSEGSYNVPGLGRLDVRATDERGSIVLASERSGLRLWASGVKPNYIFHLPLTAVKGAKGLGIFYRGPGASKTVDLVYVEAWRAGVPVAAVSDGVFNVLKGYGLVERLARGGRVLWVPSAPAAGGLAYFHPSTLLWLAATTVNGLRGSGEPLARVSLALLGIGVGLLALLPLLALSVEEPPAGERRRFRVVAWMHRGRGS